MAARGGPRLTRTGLAQAVPPPLVSPVLQRPELEARLDEILDRRLATVTAEAGFGKSTLLAAWAQSRPIAWYTIGRRDREVGALASGVAAALTLRVPALAAALRGLDSAGHGPDARADEALSAGAHAAAIADALDEHLPRDLVLVIDDVSEIGPADAGARFIEALVRMAPPRLRLVLASRYGPPFAIERLRGRGQVLAVDGTDLAFRADETEQLLGEMLGAEAARLAPDLQAATGGWPAAVRLAAEALRSAGPGEWSALLVHALRPGGPVYGYLAQETLGHVPGEGLALLEIAAQLPRIGVQLAESLGVERAEEIIPQLAQRGLFLQPTSDPGWYQLIPLMRQHARSFRRPGRLPPIAPGDLLARAAAWFADRQEFGDALACLVSSGEHESLAAFIGARGADMVAEGAVDAVLEAIDGLPAECRTPEIEEIEGRARQVRGDWDGALRCFRRITDTVGPIPAALAWPMGLIQHLRGELDDAVATYARAVTDDRDLANQALLRAWWASALWLRGEVDVCRALAALALHDAEASEDDRALAAAHTVLAMLAALDSDRRANDAHYLRALDHAERARDVLQVIRIRSNRGSRLAEEGYYSEALAELDEAIRLADLTGFAAFRALALSNRGETLVHSGRLDEAITELETARRLYQRLDSRLVAYPLSHLGDVYRERGDTALARAHYEEAVAVAERAGDLQGLVPALSGLARVLVRSEPDRALALAERAVAAGPMLGRAAALLGLGWVVLARGERQRARRVADEAEALARRRRDRAALAEAIVLAVRSADTPAAERSRLDEAQSLWRDLGDPLGVARAQLASAEFAEQRDDVAVRSIFERLHALGARRLTDEAAGLLDGPQGPRADGLFVRSLGGFEIVRGGESVPVAAWRSRKARDALKLLVAARGRRLPREVLLDILWPGEATQRTSPRLSVIISTIRSVLDPDKAHPPDHYLVADRTSVGLRPQHLRIDLEQFHAAAARGLALLATGQMPEAAAQLRVAEAVYGGDFLAEDVYDDWSTTTREEASATYRRVTRALAEIALADGEPDSAVAFLLRLLERDPWDEEAHLALVTALSRAGRHGEARRAYRRYAGRMEELGVEAAAMPAPGPA